MKFSGGEYVYDPTARQARGVRRWVRGLACGGLGTGEDGVVCRRREHLEHLECGLQPSPPGCFTIKLSEARGNGIGFVAAGEAAPPS